MSYLTPEEATRIIDNGGAISFLFLNNITTYRVWKEKGKVMHSEVKTDGTFGPANGLGIAIGDNRVTNIQVVSHPNGISWGPGIDKATNII